MSDSAISTINPAATCPEWCIGGHHDYEFIPDERGSWGTTHHSVAVDCQAFDPVPTGTPSTTLMVNTEMFTCESPEQWTERAVRITEQDPDGPCLRTELHLTPVQALRLAEVLVQHAAEIIAGSSVTEAHQ